MNGSEGPDAGTRPRRDLESGPTEQATPEDAPPWAVDPGQGGHDMATIAPLPAHPALGVRDRDDDDRVAVLGEGFVPPGRGDGPTTARSSIRPPSPSACGRRSWTTRTTD
jgi:hypothetical protein